MKKWRIIIIAAVIMTLLTACGRKEPLFSKMGKDVAKWAKEYDTERPPALTIYQEKNGGAQKPIQITRKETINQIFEALSNVRVGRKMRADDEATTYIFTFADEDGKKQSFTLVGNDGVQIENNIHKARGTEEVLKAAGLWSEMSDEDLEEESPLDMDTEEPQSEPEDEGTAPADDLEEYAVFRSEMMNFSFLYNPSYPAQMTSGGGAVIYTGNTQGIPYMEVLCISEGPDAQEYLEETRYHVQMELGDSLVADGGEPFSMELEGRDMLAIVYDIMDESSGAQIETLCMAENLSGGGVAVFSATYVRDDEESTMDAISGAVVTFQPDANYYSDHDGASNQQVPEPQQQPKEDADSEPTQTTMYQLEKYETREFTMMVPKGWIVETGGEYAGFCIRAYDPNNQDVQIFYYGELGPYFRSESGKAMYQEMSQGMDSISKLPVLNPGTLQGCLNSLDDYQECYNAIMPTGYTFAKIHNLSNISEKPVTTFLSSMTVSESMLMANLTSTTGKPCTGIFQGSIADANPYATEESDYTPSRAAMNVFGVIAPEEQFATVSETLIQSLCSFRFTEEYIKEGVNYTNAVGQSAMEYSRQNNEMMDRINQNFTDYIRGN